MNNSLTLFLIFVISFNALESYAQAIKPYGKEARYEEYRQDSLRIAAIHGMGWYYFFHDQFDSLDLSARQIMVIAKKWMEYDTFSRIHYYLSAGAIGTALARQGYFAKGLPILKNYTDSLLQIETAAFNVSTNYISIGIIYEKLGDSENALEYYLKGEQIQEELVKKGELDPGWLDAKLIYLADIYWKLGNYALSERLRIRAIESGREKKDYCYNLRYLPSLSQFYIDTKSFSKAKNAIDAMALEIKKSDCEIRKYSELEQAFTVGSYYFQKDSFDLAVPHFLEVVNFTGEIPFRTSDDVARIKEKILPHLIQISLKKGDFTQAETYMHQLQKVYLSYTSKNNEGWKNILLTTGKVYQDQGKYALALESYDEILKSYIPNWEGKTAGKTFDPSLWAINGWILQALRERTITTYALWSRNPSQSTKNEVVASAELTQQYLGHLLSAYSSDYSKSRIFAENKIVYEIPIKLLLAGYEENNQEKDLSGLFTLFEKSKALQLLAVINDKKLQKILGVPDDLLEEERNLNKEITIYKNQLAENYSNQHDNPELKNHYKSRLDSLRRQYDDLKVFFSKNFPEYNTLKHEVEVIKLKTLQSSLDAHQLVLSYFWGADEIYTLAIGKSHLKAWKTPLNDAFEQQFVEFQHFVSHPPKTDFFLVEDHFENYTRTAYAIYQALVEPAFEQKNDYQNITFITDGRLTSLPWACLLTEPTAAKKTFRNLAYLNSKYSSQQEYSATLLAAEFPSPRYDYPYLGFAPAYVGDELASSRGVDTFLMESLYAEAFRDGYQPLKFNISEITGVGQMFPEGLQFVGGQASESAFKPVATSGKILHLAMHAQTNDIDPLLSFLLFSKEKDKLEDGILYAYELYNMELKADLAVLSACNTGAGKLLDGQGVMSLARAFRYAGCKDVLMTLWLAHDHSASNIVSTFFQNMQDETPKAASLQQAIVQFLKEEKNDAFTHPYYWAGFTLIGKGEPIQNRPSYLLFIGLGVLIALAAFIAIRKNKLW